MPLTDVKVRNATPKNKPYKLFDGGGLFLLVKPTGGRLWRLKYRFGGKEKLLALGIYPDVSLAEARERCYATRKQLDNNIDPGQVRKAQKASHEQNENTFEVVAREWHLKFTPNWTVKHTNTILTRLENNMFPWLGARPVSELTAAELLEVLRRIESRGAKKTLTGSGASAGRCLDMPSPPGGPNETYPLICAAPWHPSNPNTLPP